MRIAVLVWLVTGLALGADKQLSEVDALRIENQQLKNQIAQLQFQVRQLTALVSGFSQNAQAEWEMDAAKVSVIRAEAFKHAGVEEKDYELEADGRTLRPKAKEHAKK